MKMKKIRVANKVAVIGTIPFIALVATLAGCIGYYMSLNDASYESSISIVINATDSNVKNCPPLMAGAGVPTFKERNDLGNIMQSENFTVGAELGVQNGFYAAEILTRWPSCTEYNLVDLWGHQENYHDFANVDQETQEAIYNDAIRTRLRSAEIIPRPVLRLMMMNTLTLFMWMPDTTSRECQWTLPSIGPSSKLGVSWRGMIM